MTKGRFRRWIVLVAVTAVALLLDWWTKNLALTRLGTDRVVPLLGDVLQLQLAFNPGAIFGTNPADYWPGFPTRAFYMVFSALMALVLVLFYSRVDVRQNRLTAWGLVLVLPGALGNLVDRALDRPGVVDFIRMDFGFPPFHPWPLYNVADIYITVGVEIGRAHV